MKIRTGFVSNSSSSSFIVIGKKPQSGSFAKLNKDQAKKVIQMLKNTQNYTGGIGYRDQEEYCKKVNLLTEDMDFYLTGFISDCLEEYDEMSEDPDAIPFREGGYGCPYDENYYHEISDRVWLPKTEKELKKEGIIDED